MSSFIGMYLMPASISFLVGAFLVGAFLYREKSEFVKDLKLFLRRRMISHNQAKTQLVILQNKYDELAKAFDELKSSSVSRTVNFSGALSDKDFIGSHNSQMEKLELEITSIQEVLTGDIKKQLLQYMKEVDGLSLRLGRAKQELRAKRSRNSFELLDSKDIA